MQTAADEVDDFQAVAVVEGSLVPAGARDDVAIEFNGNSIGLRSEVLNQRRKRCYFGKFLVFTVDLKAHE